MRLEESGNEVGESLGMRLEDLGMRLILAEIKIEYIGT